MKKLFALLSVTAFLAVSVHAQSSKTTQEVKKEVSVTKANASSDVKSDSPKAKAASSCCMKSKAAASCCKDGMKDAKNCTAAEKAACAKAGKDCSHDHAKAEGKMGCLHDHAKAEEEKGKVEKAE